MRCCASQIICSVDKLTAARAGEMIEAMLLAPILRPMIASAGMLGDYELDLLANDVARHDGRGFAGLIAAHLQSPR
jgi:hypothetical protein